MIPPTQLPRRRFLSGVALGAVAAAFYAPGIFAEMLSLTPRQTEGPFYPDHLPLDTDNDLIILNDATTPAVGEVTYLSGRLLGADGEPMRGAVIEIWQCDHNGNYIHSRGGDPTKRDSNFQGFGRFLTGSSGEYLFRTIKPVRYAGRTPHIHMKVKSGDKELLTTQCYVKGEAQNGRDFVYRDLRDDRERAAITVDFAPMRGAKAGELAARLDLIVGTTPAG